MITRPELYLQARDRILERIEALAPGDRLPAEHHIARELGVSRNTVRDALTRLERDGHVIRRHGLGTFVAPRAAALGTRLNEFIPIPDMIRAAGFEPAVSGLVTGTRPASSDAARALGAVEGEPLECAEMLYLAGSHPAVHITYALAPDLGRRGVPWAEFGGGMVSFAERCLGARVHHSHTRLRATLAPPPVAASLGVDAAAPLLRFDTVALTAGGRAVYHSVSYQDSDFLEVSAVRSRK